MIAWKKLAEDTTTPHKGDIRIGASSSSLNPCTCLIYIYIGQEIATLHCFEVLCEIHTLSTKECQNMFQLYSRAQCPEGVAVALSLFLHPALQFGKVFESCRICSEIPKGSRRQ